MAALRLTLIASVIVVLINAVAGTLIAWVLVRDEFPGKGIVNSLIDLPFALPTIVAGLTLLAFYGPDSPVGVNLAFTRVVGGAGAAVRDAPVRGPGRPAGAARAGPGDGAGGGVARREPAHGLPAHHPAQPAAGDHRRCGLAFARAVGEFGSLVLITGNLPFKTQAASVFIFSQVESDNPIGAAAVSVVLLVAALLILLLFGWLSKRALRHEE